ncbi:MAG: hypothetical protein IID01_04385 [Chloroflexi bacterium]|nr:hypothetical protein [Chloroflexota bacterium]
METLIDYLILVGVAAAFAIAWMVVYTLLDNYTFLPKSFLSRIPIAGLLVWAFIVVVVFSKGISDTALTNSFENVYSTTAMGGTVFVVAHYVVIVLFSLLSVLPDRIFNQVFDKSEVNLSIVFVTFFMLFFVEG